MANFAHTIFRCRTNPDGSFRVHWWTNDDLDYGYPSVTASADWTCKDQKDFENRIGKSRVGCIGTIVEVFLDGVKI